MASLPSDTVEAENDLSQDIFCDNLDCPEFIEFVKNMQVKDFSPLDEYIDKIKTIYDMFETNNFAIFNDDITKNYLTKKVIVPVFGDTINKSEIDLKKQNLLALLSITLEKMNELKIKNKEGQILHFTEAYIHRFFNNRMIYKLENNIFKYGKINKIIIDLAQRYKMLYQTAHFQHMKRHTCGIYYLDNCIYICNSGCETLLNTILINHLDNMQNIRNAQINIFDANRRPLDIEIYVDIILFSIIKCIINANYYIVEHSDKNKVNVKKIAQATQQNNVTDLGKYTAYQRTSDANIIHFRQQLLYYIDLIRTIEWPDCIMEKLTGKVDLNYLIELNEIIPDVDPAAQGAAQGAVQGAAESEISQDGNEGVSDCPTACQVFMPPSSSPRSTFLVRVSRLNSTELFELTNMILHNVSSKNFDDLQLGSSSIMKLTKINESIKDKIKYFDNVHFTLGETPIIFVENYNYKLNFCMDQAQHIIDNQFIPFKVKSQDELNCHNGSTCAEPKLFNWLISNNIIKAGKRDNIFGSFNLGYSLNNIEGKQSYSGYSIYTEPSSSDTHKKLYTLGYFLYILKNYASAPPDAPLTADDLIYEISSLEDRPLPIILLDLMLPCQGCKMNYLDIIHNHLGKTWSSKFCNQKIFGKEKKVVSGGSITNTNKTNNRKISKKKMTKTNRSKVGNKKKLSKKIFLDNKKRHSKRTSI
jgi:hypothetical protein